MYKKRLRRKDRFFIDSSRGHVHYFYCDVCHSFIEIGHCVVKVADIERTPGAVVKKHILLYSGLFKMCLNKCGGSS